MADYVKVAAAADITAGHGATVRVKDKDIAVFNIGGTFYAIDNVCVHRGGPLGEGEVEGKIVTCPWHGWQYDVTTGCNPHNPAVKVGCYPVKVENGEILVSA